MPPSFNSVSAGAASSGSPTMYALESVVSGKEAAAGWGRTATGTANDRRDCDGGAAGTFISSTAPAASSQATPCGRFGHPSPGTAHGRATSACVSVSRIIYRTEEDCSFARAPSRSAAVLHTIQEEQLPYSLRLKRRSCNPCHSSF